MLGWAAVREQEAAQLWTYLSRWAPDEGHWLTQPEGGVVLLAEG
jgi:hypothetical protein